MRKILPIKMFNIDFTSDVSTITSIGKGQILTGHKKGIINLWQYERPHILDHIRGFDTGDQMCIMKIVRFSEAEDKFILIGDACLPNHNYNTIYRWDLSSGKIQLQCKVPKNDILGVIMLPNDLLAYSRYAIFDVLDIHSLKRIYTKEVQPRDETIVVNAWAVTAHGFLAILYKSSGIYNGKSNIIFIWKVDRSECKLISKYETLDRINAMATLPTGEIITGGGKNLNFYKISPDLRWVYHCKTVKTDVIIYDFHPIGGTKFLTNVRWSVKDSVTLWNYEPQAYHVISENIATAGFCFGHTILTREGVIISAHRFIPSIIISEYDEDIFRACSGIAAVMISARLLSQAWRTGKHDLSNDFGKLPIEMNLKIATMACEVTNKDQTKVIEKIAEKYFYQWIDREYDDQAAGVDRLTIND